MTEQRRNWVWVTKKDYFLEEDGSDGAFLDPSTSAGREGSWWTCHADTRAGDLILMYCGVPKSAIAYLLEAKSNPWKLGERSDDGVVTRQRFEQLVDTALANGVVSAFDVERYREDRDLAFAGSNTLRKRGWRLDRLDSIRAEHEERGAQLVEREKSEGYSESIQHEFDNYEEEDEQLQLVEELEVIEDGLAFSLGEIREAVFAEAGLATDTLIGDESEWLGALGCRWVPRCKLPNPLSLKEMQNDAWLADNWNALRAGFQGRAFLFDDESWLFVTSLLIERGNECMRDYA